MSATGRGRFVTLEGGEGAGKTTLARSLCARLAAAGHPVLRTREPGGAPGAEAVRALLLGAPAGVEWNPMSEALLVSAARREHVAATVAPMLRAGGWVVCDRFTDSTLAYQGIAGGLGREACERLAAMATGGLRPDLTLVVDVPVATGLLRARMRGEQNRFEARGVAFHGRVRDAFRAIAAADPGRCVVLDGAASAEAVLEAALAALRARLGAPLGLRLGPTAGDAG